MMQLVTAESIKNDLKTINACEGLDKWIVDSIRPKFIQSAGKAVTIDQRSISSMWPSHAFESAMIKRGFRVELICEDRPCAYPYYKIEL